MFCGECGTKNTNGDLFCANCGSKLEQNIEKKKESNEQIVVKEKRKIKHKGLKILLLIVVVIIGVGYKIGSDITSPNGVAKRYLDARVSGKVSSLYKYLDLDGDKTFVSKEIFEKGLEKNLDNEKYNNYRIKDVIYSSGKLNASVSYSYTSNSTGDDEINDTVELVKLKNKKYFIFDNWQVTSVKNSYLVSKYKLYVPKDAKVTFGEIEVDKKYLDSDNSNDYYDCYLLPQVFKIKTDIKLVLDNGFEIEDSLVPSDSGDKIIFDTKHLSKKAKDEILKNGLEAVTKIYDNAIKKNKYSDIKESFPNAIDKFETNYNNLVSVLSSKSGSSSYPILKKITFTDTLLDSVSLEKDILKAVIKFNYSYTVEYTYWNEVETSDKNSSSYMYVYFTMKDGKYEVVNVNNLETSFSRY